MARTNGRSMTGNMKLPITGSTRCPSRFSFELFFWIRSVESVEKLRSYKVYEDSLVSFLSDIRSGVRRSGYGSHPCSSSVYFC